MRYFEWEDEQKRMENRSGEKLDARNKTQIKITAEPRYTIPHCTTDMIMFSTMVMFYFIAVDLKYVYSYFEDCTVLCCDEQV
jgi:hypothetical protein